MRIYLDVSCLNRPFDDQGQDRIRLESEAVVRILERIDNGEWSQVASDMVTFEIEANRDPVRRRRLLLLVSEESIRVNLGQEVWDRALILEALGFKSADAVHIAAAEVESDVFVSCDDRLCRLAKRCQAKLRVRVANPVDWLREMSDAENT